jgi:putative peptide zinc metalloprotease protein
MTRQMMPTRSMLRLALLLLLVLAPALGTVAPARAQTADVSSIQGGGGNNVVVLRNHSNGRLTTSGEIQLNRIPGPTAGPANLASAYSSCVDCQSLAMALQINLISRTARSITPENAAVAVNEGCTRCYTVARAIQYVLQVDDPTHVPPEVSRLIQSMDRELNAIRVDRGMTLSEAEARINAVIAQFTELAHGLNDVRDEQVDATSPMLTATLPPVPTPSSAPVASTASPVSSSGTSAPIPTATSRPADPTPTPAVTSMPTSAPTSTVGPTLAPSATPLAKATGGSVQTPTPAATGSASP